MSSSRYHIAHILPFPASGGTEMSTLRIARGLEGERFKNTAFCLKGPALSREMFESAGFDTESFDAVEPSFHRPQPFLSSSLGLARKFKQLNVNLVHCSDLLAAYYTALAGKLAGLPVLCHVRNRYERISRRERSFLYPVTRFVFVSRDAWDRFGFKVPAWRGSLIYDGVDAVEVDRVEAKQSVRREFRIPASAKIVGMAARVAPQKDYATLVKAAARVVSVHQDVRFLIIGDHSRDEANRQHYGEVQRLLAESGLASHFIFTGHRNDIFRLLGALDVSVLCTHIEGFGLVIAEAMTQARPVIATAVGGTPEIVIHGENGLLHEHENAEQLAAQMLTLLTDESYAARLGQAGQRFVKTNFRGERFITQMSELYCQMIDARRRVAGGHKSKGPLGRVRWGN